MPDYKPDYKIVYDPLFLEHEQWPGHPECPERLLAIVEGLEESGAWKQPLAIESVDRGLVEKIHTPDYISLLETRHSGALDPDTYLHEKTFDIAWRALSGAYTAMKHSFSTGEPVFALLRPPGHHAGPSYYGGFCYLNNAALAAETAVHLGAKRVAIVDIDVHHGNGTRDIMAERKDVLYISTHQWGIYPGTGPAEDVGSGEGEGYTVNIPLPSGAGDRTYEMAMEEIIHPILSQYGAEALVVSLGLDAHYMDPLATISLSTPAYIWLMMELLSHAEKHLGGRCVTVLEGGYHLDALRDFSLGLGKLLMPDNRDSAKILDTLRFTKRRDTEGLGREAIDRVLEVQGSHWSL